MGSEMTTPRKRKPVEITVKHEEEKACLSCVLQAGATGSQAEVDALLDQLTPSLFFNEDHKLLFESMRRLRAERHAVDSVTVVSSLKRTPEIEKQTIDRIIAGLPAIVDAAPTWFAFPTYLDSVQDAALRRWTLGKRDSLTALVNRPDFTIEQLRNEFAELSEKASKIGKPKRNIVITVKFSEHLKFIPKDTSLIGDSDIQKGYQGVTVIAGPPGSGKSMVSMGIAIAGAIGNGYWQGRKVHRKFKTLIIQSENGEKRLLHEFQAMKAAYPNIDFDSHIRVTLPPEGGLPFGKPEFRREIQRIIEEFKPDVVIVDPWTAVAVDDQSKDIVEKLAEIRSLFPPGDQAPGLVIVAHTKKPRAEDKGNRGRSLMFSVSGSQALVATARCVYLVFPFTEDIQDDRILFACAKLSDSKHAPADTVWHRELGQLFRHCDDDPSDFWSEDARDKGPWLEPEMLKEVLGRSAMTQSRLASTLAEKYNKGSGVSSVHKWLKRTEFACHLEDTDGLLSWKD